VPKNKTIFNGTKMFQKVAMSVMRCYVIEIYCRRYY